MNVLKCMFLPFVLSLGLLTTGCVETTESNNDSRVIHKSLFSTWLSEGTHFDMYLDLSEMQLGVPFTVDYDQETCLMVLEGTELEGVYYHRQYQDYECSITDEGEYDLHGKVLILVSYNSGTTVYR